ncbi:MAG TPA: ROK family protein [Acidimicrobiia bacterium]|nr:ROK family protein [Acidimicrobiia bacterium]
MDLQFVPPLDPDHRPAIVFNRAFMSGVLESSSDSRLQIAMMKPDGSVTVHETSVYHPDHPRHGENLFYAERFLKTRLWQRGASRVLVAGPPDVVEHLVGTYSPEGARAFDAGFMGTVYGDFSITAVSPADLPAPAERTVRLGRHLDGHRIGFDLGASDYKVSAVSDGEVVWAGEYPWEPRTAVDVSYHHSHIDAGLRAAAAHLPTVEAIGGSSAGVWIDNQVRVASLFRGIPPDAFARDARTLFSRIRDEWDVPLEIVNDGEVTALAGSMSLGADAVLGIAMGSSEAAGYVNRDGDITGWLNELAFAPIDYSATAPIDEWSGDAGCGAQYFSQIGAIRLAGAAGIDLDASTPPAERLVTIQALMAAGDSRAHRVYETIGCWLGYAVAHYATLYDIDHVLVLGRVCSGNGGEVIVAHAEKVLAGLDETSIFLHIPDERLKRVGQSVAAASLPVRPGTP